MAKFSLEGSVITNFILEGLLMKSIKAVGVLLIFQTETQLSLPIHPTPNHFNRRGIRLIYVWKVTLSNSVFPVQFTHFQTDPFSLHPAQNGL